MSDYIREAFDTGGQLARLMRGYLPRVGQIRLAQAVDSAIDKSRILLAEVPAGVGKSFGYGVPVTYQYGQSNEDDDNCRALIVTSNIALQEQLVEKDLPFLAEALPWEFSFALLKGRSNYLCLSKLQQVAEDPGELSFYGDVDHHLRMIGEWAVDSETGDVSELPVELPPGMWSRFSCGKGECKGGACKHVGDCFHAAAKRRAESADVVVCNYHLLFGAMAAGESSAEGGPSPHVLPPFDTIVMDEAHRAADIARDFFGFRVTARTFERCAGLLKRVGEKDARAALLGAGHAFMKGLLRHAASGGYKVRLRGEGEINGGVVLLELAAAAGLYGELAKAEADGELRSELRMAAGRCKKAAARIEAATLLTGEDVVYFIEESNGRVALCSKATDVGKRLRKGLWDRVDSAALVSATLRVGGKLGYVVKELGVPVERADELTVDSPFDFREQAMLVISEGMPEPTSPGFADAVGKELRRAVDFAGGRTLALFTSRRVLNVARRALDGCGYPVLVQGDEPRTRLVERFREDVSSVLLGLDSFWAGVDVPGEALTCLVIDRLPFPRPDDPVLDKVKEKVGSQWFQQYSIPRSVTTFRQGFGRLIRSVHDRGAVVVLDRRLTDKPYGKTFLRGLPPVMVTRRLEDAAHLLRPVPVDEEQLARAGEALDGL